MSGKVSIKTILVLVILLLVGVLGVLGMDTMRTYLSGASADMTPSQVMSKVGEDGKSATISWTTLKETKGYIEYGTTPASLLLRSEIESGAPTLSHSVTIEPLKANVNYYYRLRAGDESKDKNEWEVFDNGGIPYSFNTKTGSEIAEPTPTVALVTTVPPTTVTTAPASGSDGCQTGIDYNNDGIVNSIDLITCRTQGATGASVAPTSTSGCKTDVDYDGNGTINSLDRIKCLQDAQH
ncbi:MAG: fibronectin type III domain-containing protein [Candidatus Shapirobacteria bacterium]|jgi:hypothetical protein